MPAVTGDSGPDSVVGGSAEPTTWGPGSEVLPLQETQLPKNATLFERVSLVGERIKQKVDKFFEEFQLQHVEF